MSKRDNKVIARMHHAVDAYIRAGGNWPPRDVVLEEREACAKLAEESSYHYHRECPLCGYCAAKYLHCRHDGIPSHCAECGAPLPSAQPGECDCNMMVEPNEIAASIRSRSLARSPAKLNQERRKP